jgi:hypothetical protein
MMVSYSDSCPRVKDWGIPEKVWREIDCQCQEVEYELSEAYCPVLYPKLPWIGRLVDSDWIISAMRID